MRLSRAKRKISTWPTSRWANVPRITDAPGASSLTLQEALGTGSSWRPHPLVGGLWQPWPLSTKATSLTQRPDLARGATSPACSVRRWPRSPKVTRGCLSMCHGCTQLMTERVISTPCRREVQRAGPGGGTLCNTREGFPEATFDRVGRAAPGTPGRAKGESAGPQCADPGLRTGLEDKDSQGGLGQDPKQGSALTAQPSN